MFDFKIKFFVFNIKYRKKKKFSFFNFKKSLIDKTFQFIRPNFEEVNVNINIRHIYFLNYLFIYCKIFYD